MSSPLDLTGNSHDDAGHFQATRQKGQTRREKRQQVVRVQDSMFSTHESDIATSTPRAIVNFLGDYAFLLLFNVFVVFFGAIGRVFYLMFGRFFAPSEEEQQILHDMPIEQRQQKREIEYLSGSQREQNAQLDELRRRVQKLEERRKARAKQS